MFAYHTRAGALWLILLGGSSCAREPHLTDVVEATPAPESAVNREVPEVVDESILDLGEAREDHPCLPFAAMPEDNSTWDLAFDRIGGPASGLNAEPNPQHAAAGSNFNRFGVAGQNHCDTSKVPYEFAQGVPSEP